MSAPQPSRSRAGLGPGDEGSGPDPHAPNPGADGPTLRTLGARPDGAAPGARARRRGSLYVAEHCLRRLRGYWQTVLATAFGTPLLYLFAFGIGLSTLISRNLGPGAMGGVDYLVFVAPALLATAAITVATDECTYAIMDGFRWAKFYFAMTATPIEPRQVISGTVLFVALRTAVTCAIYFAVMALFGAVPRPAGALAIGAATLTGLAFGLPLMAYACSIKEEHGQFSIVMRIVVLPMTLFSGTMFPLDSLPMAVRWLGWISPLWHGSQLAREACYGLNQPLWLTAVHVVYLVALAAVGWWLAARITTRRLRP